LPSVMPHHKTNHLHFKFLYQLSVYEI